MRARIGAVAEKLRSSLWLLPSIAVVAALFAGTAIADVRVSGGPLRAVLFTGSASGARTLLSTVAAAMITTIGVVFSVTVVALEMAAAQYSPRIVRNFLRDRGNQAVLAAFLATFAYSVAVLRRIREPVNGRDAEVPSLAVSVGIALILVSVAALVYFIQHVTTTIRVEHVLRAAARTTLATVDDVYGPRDERGPVDRELPEVPPHAVVVPAARTGWLGAASPEQCVKWATEEDVVVRFRPTVGDHVVAGIALAWVWNAGGTAERDPPDAGTIAARLDRVVSIGFERTSQQDVAFGIRQIVDIAVRALSPGVNDPTTAVDALGSLTGVLRELAARELGHQLCRDATGTVRVALPRPRFREYLDLACDQIRRYGAREPAVTGRLLQLLADIAPLADRQEEKDAVARQCRLVLEDARRETAQPEDIAGFPELADAVADGLAGRHRPLPVSAS